jgi:hypothetical protein
MILAAKVCESRRGLEEIGKGAFRERTLLHERWISPAVKAVKDGAFSQCSQRTIVNFGEGLEVISCWAFRECTSLHEILIPSTVKRIKDWTIHRQED